MQKAQSAHFVLTMLLCAGLLSACENSQRSSTQPAASNSYRISYINHQYIDSTGAVVEESQTRFVYDQQAELVRMESGDPKLLPLLIHLPKSALDWPSITLAAPKSSALLIEQFENLSVKDWHLHRYFGSNDLLADSDITFIPREMEQWDDFRHLYTWNLALENWGDGEASEENAVLIPSYSGEEHFDAEGRLFKFTITVESFGVTTTVIYDLSYLNNRLATLSVTTTHAATAPAEPEIIQEHYEYLYAGNKVTIFYQRANETETLASSELTAYYEQAPCGDYLTERSKKMIPKPFFWCIR